MKIGDTVPAYMSERLLGTFSRVGTQTLQFEYAPKWRNDNAAFPVSLSLLPSLPKHRDTQQRPVVSNYLWGLLPENDRTLREWAKSFQIGRGNPLAFLECIGADCPGAIAFGSLATAAAADRLSTEDLETELRDLRTWQRHSRLSGDVGKFSLAGAQVKTALQKRGDDWYAPDGSSPTTHILKPPIDGLHGQLVNEYACMQAARRVGIPCANASVMHFGDEQALVIERYDRFADDTGAIHRIHQEDMCQALGVHPIDKYQADGGPSLAEMAALLTMHSDEREVDRERLYRSVAFNWLIAGTDAHAKNYSLLIGPNQSVRLAPLYDINSMWPYEQRHKDTRFATKIGSQYQVRMIQVRHFLRETAKASIPDEQARDWLADLTQRLPDALASVKTDCLSQGLPVEVLGPIIDRSAETGRAIQKQMRQATGLDAKIK